MMCRDILIIKLGALGDVVMATGLIDRILRHHAPRRCTLLTSPAYGGLFSSRPGLELKTFDRRSLHSTLATVLWMRERRFLRLYDLQSNDRTGVMCSLTGIPERAGNHPRYPYNIHPRSRYTGQCHIHTRMLEILDAAGITSDGIAPCLYTLRGRPGNGVCMVAATGSVGAETRHHARGCQRPAPGKALALLLWNCPYPWRAANA